MSIYIHHFNFEIVENNDSKHGTTFVVQKTVGTAAQHIAYCGTLAEAQFVLTSFDVLRNGLNTSIIK